MTFRNGLVIGALTCPIVVVGMTGQDQSALRTITVHTDDVAPQSQPQTMTERLRQVEAVVRGRIVSSQVKFQREDVPPGVDPAYGIQPETEHTVEILEVLKDNNKLPIVGRTTTVVQPVGTVIVDGVRVVKDSDKIRPWLPGEEHVFLLRWDRAHASFSVHSEDDSFLLASGVVATNGQSPVSKAERGVTVPEFLARLRSAAARLSR